MKSTKAKSFLFYSTILTSVFLTYIFFVTAGTWKPQKYPLDYYSQLAHSFVEGSLALRDQPHPDLLAASNPFDPKVIGHIPWDSSYYKGKFYIYWGPVPAVILAGFRLIGIQLNDGDINFIFQFLRFCVVFALFALMRTRMGPKFSWIYFLPGILCLAWATPIPWNLGRPVVYEAAIAGGQFFTILGFLFWFMAETVQPNRANLLLALTGLSWGFAFGCRISLIPAIFVTACFCVLTFGQGSFEWRKKVRPAIFLGTPLALIAMLFGIYNYLRFDTPFVFGHGYVRTYQLGEPSVTFALPNLWHYLFTLPSTSSEFPFFYATGNVVRPLPFFLNMPSGYCNWEPIVGIVLAVPFILFALYPIVDKARSVFRNRRGHDAPLTLFGDEIVEKFFWSFLLYSLFAIAGLMMHPAVTMRFLLDFGHSAMMASTLGLSVFVSTHSPTRRRVILTIAFATSVYCCFLAFCLWTDSNISIVKTRNPELWLYLKNFF